jgi:hypothetical protein
MLGVDYPWDHPAPSAMQAAGVGFALRYLSRDPSKNLSRAEADALAAAGIWVGVVWETTAGRALDGRAAGTADAQEALRQAQACGMPPSRPIYFAVDTDTTWSAVAPYFQGVRDVLPASQIGVYGGIKVVTGAADSGLVTWYWQASAWSYGRWEPRAHVRQLGYITIGGVQCDRNQSMTADYGQWMPGRTPDTEEDPLMAFTEADLRRIVREEVTSQTVRDTVAYAVWWWGAKGLAGTPVPGATGTGWEPILAALKGAIAAGGPDAEQLQAAVRAALADSIVHVQVDVTSPNA